MGSIRVTDPPHALITHARVDEEGKGRKLLPTLPICFLLQYEYCNGAPEFRHVTDRVIWESPEKQLELPSAKFQVAIKLMPAKQMAKIMKNRGSR